MQGGTNPGASIALRGGGTATLYSDRLELPSRRIALADLAWAGLVVDTNVPTAPGGWPTPAIGLQLREGTQVIVPVADPPESWRLLEALYQQRPDLRQPLPPQPGRAGAGGDSPGGGPVPPPYPSHSAMSGGPYAGPAAGASTYGYYGTPPSSEMVLGGIAHLSIFFAPLLLPLILWLVTQRTAPYASRQAKQAFFFHLGYLIMFAMVAVVWVLAIFGGIIGTAATSSPSVIAIPIIAMFALWGFVLLIVLAEYGFSIYGAVQAFQGRPFSYPFLGRL